MSPVTEPARQSAAARPARPPHQARRRPGAVTATPDPRQLPPGRPAGGSATL